MGLVKSCMHIPSHGFYTIEAEVGRWKSQFELLRLNESEVGQLYKVFQDVDLKRKKTVDTAHLANYLKVENKFFVKRMLSSFRRGVKFEAFVFEVWDLCTIEEKDLADFVFNLYDKDKSGDISMEEAQIMLNELYGEEFFKDGSNRSKDIMGQLYDAEDILAIEKVSFREFSKKQPSVLFLAFTVQKSIIRGLIGNTFWQRQIKKRNKLYGSEIDIISQLREDILSGKFKTKVGLKVEVSDVDLNPTQLNKDKPMNGNGIPKTPSPRSVVATNMTPRALNIDIPLSYKTELLEKELSERFIPTFPSTTQSPRRPASAHKSPIKENLIQVTKDNSSNSVIPALTETNIETPAVETKAKKSRKRLAYKGTSNLEQFPTRIGSTPLSSLFSESGKSSMKELNPKMTLTNGVKVRDVDNVKKTNVNIDSTENIENKLGNPLSREKKVRNKLSPIPVCKKSKRRVAYKGSSPSTLVRKPNDDRMNVSPMMICGQDNSEKENKLEMVTTVENLWSTDESSKGVIHGENKLIESEESILNNEANDQPHLKECTKSALKTSSSKITIVERKAESSISFIIKAQLKNRFFIKDRLSSKKGKGKDLKKTVSFNVSFLGG